MPWLRRRYLRGLAFWACAVTWWSCGPARLGVRDLPSSINPDALRDTILASIDTTQFDAYEGDEQIVKDPIIGSATRGEIQPHKASFSTPQSHRKVIARIRVSKDYRELKKDVWNYWALVDTSSNASGKFVSAWVSAGNPLVLRELSTARHAPHPHARARWLNHSAALPWATCDALTCCCEGPRCLM